MDRKITELNNLYQASRITFTEIAKQTGISVATVSRYIKGDLTRIKEGYYDSIYSVVSKSLVQTTDTKQVQVDMVKKEILESKSQNNVQSEYCKLNSNTNNGIGNNSNFIKQPRRGDIFYIRNIHATGNEMYGSRPGVIVSNNKINESSGVVEVCYITSKPKCPLPTHVNIKTNRDLSIVLCEQIHTVSRERIEKFFFHITDAEINNIDKALSISLGLNYNNNVNRGYNDVLKAERDFYKNFYDMVMKINMVRAESGMTTVPTGVLPGV